MHARFGPALNNKTVDSIFDQGLHEFLTEFISRNNRIASAIAEDYRFIA